MQIKGYYCTKKKCQVWLKHSPQQNLNVIPERVLAQLGMLEKIGSAELTDDTNFARIIEKQGYCITKTAVIFEAEQHFVHQGLPS
ncbi:hypothetical protein ACO2Q8_25980 [Larkinella sp. VNQ87]|uniref:hypothetical protein n=1 Tax=Larkinella sp. VNQ87 TaxID=3400921 RepID=UPI003C0A4231